MVLHHLVAGHSSTQKETLASPGLLQRAAQRHQEVSVEQRALEQALAMQVDARNSAVAAIASLQERQRQSPDEVKQLREEVRRMRDQIARMADAPGVENMVSEIKRLLRHDY